MRFACYLCRCKRPWHSGRSGEWEEYEDDDWGLEGRLIGWAFAVPPHGPPGGRSLPFGPCLSIPRFPLPLTRHSVSLPAIIRRIMLFIPDIQGGAPASSSAMRARRPRSVPSLSSTPKKRPKS